jgi:hypothetical protein
MQVTAAGWDDLGLSAPHRFFGTYLIAVTGSFGFLAPVLATHSPAVLE